MQSYIIFDEASGDITGFVQSSEEPEPPQGFGFLEGDPVDPSLFRVVNGALEARPAPLYPQAPRRYSFNEWVDRFPFEAQVAIVTATLSDPVARLIYDRAFSAGGSSAIDPTDPRTAQGLQYLVAQEYITQAQADAALAP